MTPRARATTALFSMVLNTGLTAAELSAEADVPIEWLEQPTVMAYERAIEIWNAAERLTGDPAVGLRAGTRFDIDQLGPLSASFTLAPTLRASLKTLPELLGLVIRGVPMSVEEDSNGASFCYRSPGTSRHGVDSMFAAILTVVRRATWTPDLAAQRVHLQSAPPPDVRPYRAVFGVEPLWHQPRSELRFGLDDLARRFRGGDLLGAEAMTEIARRRFGTSAEPGVAAVVSEVRGALESLLPQQQTDIGSVAHELHLSARTLQRRLREAGTTFGQCRDEILRREADRLLGRPELALDQIAEQLGFSGRVAFSRAYRRWTGRSPGEARRS